MKSYTSTIYCGHVAYPHFSHDADYTFEAPVLNVVPRHHEHDDATEEVEALNARRPVVGWAADVDKDICFGHISKTKE